MQELIYVADVLISDYSSCIWDASLAGIPCFLYVRDLKKYLSDRNFYTPISEWPFPMAQSEDELCRIITNFNERKYAEDVASHHKALGSFESGEASKKIFEYIESKSK